MPRRQDRRRAQVRLTQGVETRAAAVAYARAAGSRRALELVCHRPDGQTGGVVNASGTLNMSSPRIRPIAVFDINQLHDDVRL